MPGTIDARLAELGLKLPEPAQPLYSYVPFVETQGLVHVAGQVPIRAGEVLYRGRVGAEVTLEQAQEAARLCALNILGHLRTACGGDLDRVRRVVKLGCFVAVAPDFVDSPKVANAASELLGEVFGEAGRHARFAVGVATLPLGVPVEIDAIAEIAPG
jgi:enamine deaminase RidA (YjgF/YER057c/UK114 family)